MCLNAHIILQSRRIIFFEGKNIIKSLTLNCCEGGDMVALITQIIVRQSSSSA